MFLPDKRHACGNKGDVFFAVIHLSHCVDFCSVVFVIARIGLKQDIAVIGIIHRAADESKPNNDKLRTKNHKHS